MKLLMIGELFIWLIVGLCILCDISIPYNTCFMIWLITVLTKIMYLVSKEKERTI